MKKGIKILIELSSKSYLENDALSEPHLDIEDLLKDIEGVSFIWHNTWFFGKLFEKGSLEEISKLYKSLSTKFKDRFLFRNSKTW